MVFAIRAPARSTSGSQSDHAVIDLVRHCSANSARSSAARAGTQPSECEIRCTHCSSAGNALRCSSSESATGSAAMACVTTAAPRLAGSAVVAGVLTSCLLLRRPLGEHLVPDVPQLGEEPLLEAVREQVGRLALERRRPGPDDPIDQHQVALAPDLEQLIVVDQPLAELVELLVIVRALVDLAQRDALLLEVAGERRPHQLTRQLEHRPEPGRLLARA